MARLRQLIVYRGIMQDPVMAAVQEMLDCENARQRMDKACELAGRLIEKAEQYLLEGNIMEDVYKRQLYYTACFALCQEIL